MSADLDVVQKLGVLAEKLLREVERLRRDVTKLDSKFPKEKGRAPVDPLDVAPDHQRSWTIAEAVNVIESARALIQACEYDIAAIRSKLDDAEQPNTAGQHGRRIMRNVRPRTG